MHNRNNKEAGIITMLIAEGGAGACQLDYHGPTEGPTDGSMDLRTDRSSSNPRLDIVEKIWNTNDVVCCAN